MKQVVVEQTYKLVSYTLIVPLLGCGSSTAKSSAAPSATYAVVAAPETRETSTLPSAVQIVLKRAPDSERHMLALGIKNVSHRPLVINLGNNFNPTSVAISIWGADAGELAWRFVGGGIAPEEATPLSHYSARRGFGFTDRPYKIRRPAKLRGSKATKAGRYKVSATLQGSPLTRGR
jgi:hypothetical protein